MAKTCLGSTTNKQELQLSDLACVYSFKIQEVHFLKETYIYDKKCLNLHAIFG